MGVVAFCTIWIMAVLAIGWLMANRRAGRLQKEFEWRDREPIRRQQSAMEFNPTPIMGLCTGPRVNIAADGSVAQKAARKIISNIDRTPISQTGTVRAKRGMECLATTRRGSKFLVGEDGRLVWSRPKGKEMSIWSQC